jgi:hypothetical protein
MTDRRQVNAEAVNDRVKLLFHRLIARRLASDPDALDLAHAELDRQRLRRPGAVWIEEWATLLAQGADRVRAEIVRRDERMTRLRLSSPLVFMIDVKDEDLRRRIWRRSRQHLTRQAREDLELR